MGSNTVFSQLSPCLCPAPLLFPTYLVTMRIAIDHSSVETGVLDTPWKMNRKLKALSMQDARENSVQQQTSEWDSRRMRFPTSFSATTSAIWTAVSGTAGLGRDRSAGAASSVS